MKEPYTLLHPEDKGEKFRNELKYVCAEGELQQILGRIHCLCQPDPHAGSAGIYNIRSIYFDDHRNSCFYENENGTDPREKFRIRSYNASDSRITLECKKKENRMTRKEMCPLTKAQYRKILDGTLGMEDLNSNLLRKFYAQQAERHMEPKVIAAYERTPFIYGPGNVRITFDRNIGSSTDIDGFFDAYLPLRPVMPVGKHILEVKFDEFLPDFLYGIMNLGSLTQTTFSKYYLCRKFTV